MDQALAPVPDHVLDSKAKPPGIAMMVAGGFFALLSIGGGAIYLAIFGFAAMAPQSAGAPPQTQDETVAMMFAITLIVVGVAFMIVLYGLIIFGGWSLMNRRRWGFALTGAILSFVAGVPCSCLPVNTLVFIPIAIWSLVVLLDAQVKDSFG